MSERVLLENAVGSIVLARPLLNAARVDLRHYLNGLNQEWVEDPSNGDRRFERVRVREELRQDRSRARGLIAHCAVVKRFHKQIANDAARLVEEAVEVCRSGHVVVRCSPFLRAPLSVQNHAMQALLSVTGGTSFLPSHKKVRAFLQNPVATTLCRCTVTVKSGDIIIARECRDLPDTQVLPGHPVVWDRRFLLRRRIENTDVIQVLPTKIARVQIEDGDQICRAIADASPVFLIGEGADRRILAADEVAEICAIEPLLGALQTFCREENWPLRRILKQMFTKSVHAE